MLQFEVRDVCGLENLRHAHKGCCLRIGGRNADGKSSLMLALGMCLSGNGNPFGLNKTLMPNYRRNGSEVATASLTVADGEYLSANWKGDGTIQSNHGPQFQQLPQLAMEIIAGLRPVGSLEEKDWKRIFSDVKVPVVPFVEALCRDFDRPIPQDADWAALSNGDHNSAIAKFIKWATDIHNDIEAKGVDGVLQNLRERRVLSKREWEAAASGDDKKETYGKAKAAKWRPVSWQEEWETYSVADMTAMLSEAEAEVSMLIGRGAADEQKRATLVEQAAQKEALSKEAKDLSGKRWVRENDKRALQEAGEKSIAAAQEEDKAAQKAIDDNQRVIENFEEEIRQADHDRNGHKCPSCSATLKIMEGAGIGVRHLVVFNEDAKEAAERNLLDLRHHANRAESKMEGLLNAKRLTGNSLKEAQDHYDFTMGQSIEHLRELAQKMGAVGEKLAAAEKAEASLAEMDKREKEGQGPVSPEEISKAENKRDHYRLMLKLRERMDKALAASVQIDKLDAIMDSIETGGVAEELKKHGSAELRNLIRKIGAVLGLDCDLSEYNPILNGRPLRFCSESEQWLLSFVIQRAMASFFNVPVMLTDRADVLDEEWRGVLWENMEKLHGRDFKVEMVIAGTTTTDEDKDSERFVDIILAEGQGIARNKDQLDGVASPK